MSKLQKIVDVHHDFIIRLGGLLIFCFFALFLPNEIAQKEKNISYLKSQIVEEMSHRIQVLDEKNIELEEQKSEFLKLFDKQMFIVREIDCLAKNIYFESANEPIEGKIAVAQVTMNRVRSSRYPSTVCNVVYQKVNNTCQFSWVCEAERRIHQNSKGWIESQTIARSIILEKKKYNIVGSKVKYFHANYVDPYWADTKNRVARIGNHIFYEN